MKISILSSPPLAVLVLEVGKGSFFTAHLSGQTLPSVELYLTDKDLRDLFEALGDHLFNEEREIRE